MNKLLSLFVLSALLFLGSCQIQNQVDYYTSLECRQKSSCLNFAIRHCEKLGKEPTNIRYSYHDERKRRNGFVGSSYRRVYKAYYQCT